MAFGTTVGSATTGEAALRLWRTAQRSLSSCGAADGVLTAEFYDVRGQSDCPAQHGGAKRHPCLGLLVELEPRRREVIRVHGSALGAGHPLSRLFRADGAEARLHLAVSL
jgi:hypothetical protein